MIFVGNDWAEAHHDVYVMDEAGTRLGYRRLVEGLKGVAMFHEMIGEHTSEASEVVVGTETDRGLWVHALVGAGYQVYAINPKAVSRYRDRHRLGERNQTVETPRCWPIWYEPTVTTIVLSLVTAPRLKGSRCWPGRIRTLSGLGHVTPTRFATLYGVLPRRVGNLR